VGVPDDFKHTTDPTIANFLNPIIDLKNHDSNNWRKT